MSTKPDAAEVAKAPPKSKKLLIIGVLVVVILAVAGVGGWLYVSKQHAAEEDGEEEVAHTEVKGPPTYLPLDNMVVNLADPGGEKVAQVGITLELLDTPATDKVKPYLPTIRSGVLLLISQRTAEELLQREGKEKLAADILAEASRPFGGGQVGHVADAPKEKNKGRKKADKKKDSDENPVRGVLFSSFIVQ